MVAFLTSSPMGDLDGRYQVDGIDHRNGFLEELRKYWKEGSRCLIASASPDHFERNEEFRQAFDRALHISGLDHACVHMLDRRWMDIREEDILSYDVIVLGGGHVPTQNAFFQSISLRKKLEAFDGILIGISAGTMNMANTVYAQPEEAGEAIDPSYERFLEGLGITHINVLPHYQMIKNYTLDGLRIFEDISYPDSEGRCFIALVDGSYIIVENGENRIYGEAYRIHPHGPEHLFMTLS